MKNDFRLDTKRQSINNQIEYKYSANPTTGAIEWERKCRKLEFYPPNEYDGQLSRYSNFDILQRSDEKVWVVNGYCEIYDGSFIQPFEITKIGDTGMSIAPCPSSA